MITNLIVIASLVLTGAFVLAWLVSPALRARIEQPKHQFQDTLQQYESARQVTSPRVTIGQRGLRSSGSAPAGPSAARENDIR